MTRHFSYRGLNTINVYFSIYIFNYSTAGLVPRTPELTVSIICSYCFVVKVILTRFTFTIINYGQIRHKKVYFLSFIYKKNDIFKRHKYIISVMKIHIKLLQGNGEIQIDADEPFIK